MLHQPRSHQPIIGVHQRFTRPTPERRFPGASAVRGDRRNSRGNDDNGRFSGSAYAITVVPEARALPLLVLTATDRLAWRRRLRQAAYLAVSSRLIATPGAHHGRRVKRFMMTLPKNEGLLTRRADHAAVGEFYPGGSAGLVASIQTRRFG